MLAHATPQDDPQVGSPTKEKIQQLQEAMLEARCDMPEAIHHFLPGVYCREFTMPAGMLVIGKIHKHTHPMMVIKGRAQIITEFDNTLVEAGFCAVSPPGAKRVVYAFEETTFVTFHHNPEDTQDLEVIEATHIEDEDFQLEYHKAVQELLS
jgi:hypothetical protein